MPDPVDAFDLERFVTAQDRDGTYAAACHELRQGRKTTHWMWFVFPQVAGLGQSPASRHFAIRSLDEARAYLAHPILGPRLAECVQILLEVEGRSAEEILGPVDAMKLHSSLTLFLGAGPDDPRFAQALDRYFGGRPDPETERRV